MRCGTDILLGSKRVPIIYFLLKRRNDLYWPQGATLLAFLDALTVPEYMCYLDYDGNSLCHLAANWPTAHTEQFEALSTVVSWILRYNKDVSIANGDGLRPLDILLMTSHTHQGGLEPRKSRLCRTLIQAGAIAPIHLDCGNLLFGFFKTLQDCEPLVTVLKNSLKFVDGKDVPWLDELQMNQDCKWRDTKISLHHFFFHAFMRDSFISNSVLRAIAEVFLDCMMNPIRVWQRGDGGSRDIAVQARHEYKMALSDCLKNQINVSSAYFDHLLRIMDLDEAPLEDN